jgi:hypothetical protein
VSYKIDQALSKVDDTHNYTRSHIKARLPNPQQQTRVQYVRLHKQLAGTDTDGAECDDTAGRAFVKHLTLTLKPRRTNAEDRWMERSLDQFQLFTVS